ncbi:hypothetical protein GGR54DRAFT_629452 [Hypoxylon sp. NC1633]|nr:hypothetical protein GGR54DRAFT_629452 [Hypoxylon sp. NC1633]
MTNVQPLQLVPRSEDIIPITERALLRRRSVADDVVQSVTPLAACFHNVVLPLAEVENDVQGDLAMVTMLRWASPEQESRRLVEQALVLFGKVEAELLAREDLYRLLKAVQDKGETLDFESQKLLNSYILDYTRAGHGKLDPPMIEYYLEKRNLIDKLRSQFNQNIRDDESGEWFTTDELDGLSKELDRYPDHEGKRFVPFKRADMQAVRRYARNPTTRRRMYVASGKRLQQNKQLFKDTLCLRQEIAQLLGYDSHAAFRLEKRVAKSVPWVNGFLRDLRDRLVPSAKREMDQILAKKKSYLAGQTDEMYQKEDPTTMMAWDVDYYSRLIEEEQHIDEEAISEFFPIPHVIPAMLDILSSFLGLEFHRIPHDQLDGAIWHDDVQVWDVWDGEVHERETFLGYLYLDLFTRPNKYKGNQNVNIQCGFEKRDGGRNYPATILMCSFPSLTSSSCALLKHSELVTLFHELGHGMHDLLSKTKYIRFHGTRSPPDFVEAPSVMLENWCWMRDELKRMSLHFTRLNPAYLEKWQVTNPGRFPPEKIPDEMVEKIRKSRSLNRSLYAVAQFDMAVHSSTSREQLLRLDETKLFNDLADEAKLITSSFESEEDRGYRHLHFGHLVSGYDAGYYGYPWHSIANRHYTWVSAHVFAAEMFQAIFAEDPRSREAWIRYRKGILEYGGSRDELSMLEEFLGHAPSADALLRELGHDSTGA